uniref:ATP-dependent DNA helicase RecG n=1 Tax=Candidatus Kentrum sp. FM TaxID=2126340 RepID=A0A450VLB2_9GAMM|nr:MAG: ATP-dependent DNA helicase RecG [Candidatus Kentron sp. FM]VFJ43548.1 MAG: ATP-dependent DNA helicase RecG [Candidatus Kentron sp. FM]VFK05592.1 MAG: ATP-dependent DNA helicase RecG [Candidatus Kentron sp. FM]
MIALLKTETDRIEWKETDKDTNDILHAACALANDLGDSREDGYLVIGVRKDGTPVGIKDSQLDDMQRRLHDLLSSTKILPTPAFDIRIGEHAGGPIVVVRVQPYPVPPVVTVNQSAWVRKGSVTTRAREADLVRLQERRPENQQPFDLRIRPDATVDDLDKKGLLTRYEIAKENDDDRDTFPAFEPWLTGQQLGRGGIGRTGAAQGNPWRPNPAALLVFGTNPQNFFPGAIIELVRYEGPDIDSAIVFRKTIAGALPDQLDTVWTQLNANLVERPAGENGIRLEFLPDYPVEALKELARNMVQHRLYEGTHAPGRIEWYQDRVEFQNPGGPFGHASEGEFGETADYRNPIITGKLAEQGYVQRLGRGIRRVQQLLAKNGNPPLEVSTDGYTRVIVRTRPIS